MLGIEKYYEGYDEDSRLIKDNSHRVEFITTTHVLDDKIKAGSKILDVGAETGRYSSYYFSKGNKITALDIVPKNVEIMKEKFKAVDSESLEIKLGDAKDLSLFESNTFDVVLCLGPIYHLLKQEDRIKCIDECLRVLKPEHCLKNHTQYICSTCGRCICIESDGKRDVYRWNFPFKTLEIAKLYLKTAEVICKDVCGIYEIIGKNNRIFYKIFHTEQDLENYLLKNKDKKCKDKKPVYISEQYIESPNAQIRKLSDKEIKDYLKEQNQLEK